MNVRSTALGKVRRRSSLVPYFYLLLVKLIQSVIKITQNLIRIEMTTLRAAHDTMKRKNLLLRYTCTRSDTVITPGLFIILLIFRGGIPV
jgi:hypothetical protein